MTRPRWSLRRVACVALYGLLLYGLVEVSRTMPYLGLPLEPLPVDCYEQARWDGRTFVKTGRVVCLR